MTHSSTARSGTSAGVSPHTQWRLVPASVYVTRLPPLAERLITHRPAMLRLPYGAVPERLGERQPILFFATRERPPHPGRNRRARELGGLALRVELEGLIHFGQRLLCQPTLRVAACDEQVVVRSRRADLGKPTDDVGNTGVGDFHPTQLATSA